MSSPSNPGLLEADRARRIFAEHIVPILLADVFPDPGLQPRAVLLVGQPGAGKTALGWALRNAVTAGSRPVVLGRSDLVPFHPEYDRVAAEFGPREADTRADGDARRWLRMTVDHLLGLRVGVIIDDVLTDPAEVADLVRALKPGPDPGAGYAVEVALLATPESHSLLTCLEKQALAREVHGVRHHPEEVFFPHALAGVVEVARWAETAAAVDAIGLYRGDTALVRRDRSATGGWVHRQLDQGAPVYAASLDAAELVERIRAMALTPRESIDWRRRHDSLATRDPRWHPLLALARLRVRLAPAMDDPIRSRPAVTFGRFQTVTRWHVDAVLDMLRDRPSVTIAILDVHRGSTAQVHRPPETRDFFTGCDRSAMPEANPITPGEQITMWRTALISAGVRTGVEFAVITRPELDPDAFNQRFAPEHVDFVLAAPYGENGTWDRRAHHAYGTVLDRMVIMANTSVPHPGTGVRQRYLAGDPAWRTHFAPGALEAFELIDGPARLFAGASESAIDDYPASSASISATVDTAFEAGLTAAETTARGEHPHRRFTDPHSIADTILDALPAETTRTSVSDSAADPAAADTSAHQPRPEAGPTP